ncbi:DUF887-domain-containing protein [Nadsonia fulvescens var. elongata DSM 6958]|uniref:DUF887-domain-containing protein n=1 Tax=Nadsonia fulvescens var. elongata DSM 6958 TaxID=857566 RepID=A0A1E3PKF6_9ASCO|nr:DUF887-domain-containing protein [Nadsonia fulvescens var. elongata DSM 6958]
MLNDPLAQFASPALIAWVTPAANRLGFTALPNHAHEILFAITLYQFIFVSSAYVVPLFAKFYPKLSKKDQINFNIHVVSQIQCILILALSFPLINDPHFSPAADNIPTYTPYAGFVCAMTCGYFLWDTYSSIRYAHLFGLGFVIHGISSLFVFVQALRPYLLPYLPTFLLYELSTPFVNNHWFFNHVPTGTVAEWVKNANGIILMLMFLFVRLGFGNYQSYNVAKDLFQPHLLKQFPVWLPVSIMSCNVVLNLLNIFWFSKMNKALVKKIKGQSDLGAGKKTE